MRRVFFVLAMMAFVGALVFGAAVGLGYEPPNPDAYGPPRPDATTADLVQASMRGCVEGLGLVEVGISDQAAVVRCRPNLGVYR